MVFFGLLGYFMVSNLSFLYYQVVSRIKTLTHHIQYPDEEEIRKYIHDIKKREFDYQFRISDERNRWERERHK